jgi:hypothetical protein
MQRLDFRSPSLELAKIQVSPGFFPNREPSGSVLITCSMALPTSPDPPVTSTTSPEVMIVEELRESSRTGSERSRMTMTSLIKRQYPEASPFGTIAGHPQTITPGRPRVHTSQRSRYRGSLLYICSYSCRRRVRLIGPHLATLPPPP